MTYELKPLAFSQVLPYENSMKKEGILFSEWAYYYGLYSDGELVGIYGIKRTGRSATFKCDYTFPIFRRRGFLKTATILRLGMLKDEGIYRVYANCTPMALSTHRKLGAKILKRYKNGVVRVEYKL